MKELQKIAERLMRIPAVPYHEAAVRDEAVAIGREHGLPSEIDRFGNLLLSINQNATGVPLVLAAHLDHPGFVIRSKSGPTEYIAELLGGVPDEYIHAETKLRLMPGAKDGWIAAKARQPKCWRIRSGEPLAAKPLYAVWELTDFESCGDQITGRACDDLIGAASALTTLIRLKQRRFRGRVIGAISRAEEVGFQGALAMAAGRSLPRESMVISLETSRELPPVKMGQGVIIRVGDRTSVFDSEATRFLTETAAGLQQRNPGFKFQRALMSGGTCEATAYQEYGFRTGAVCVALGNYHNCTPTQTIGPEYVSVQDALSMTEFLIEAALQMKNYARLVSKLPTRLRGYLREPRLKLAAT